MKLCARGLRVRYRAQDPDVLVDVNLEVGRGERVAILGPSGCGKSTLLTHLAGLRRPEQGQILVGAQALAELDAEALDKLRGEHIGFVFQRALLLPYLSVRENVQLAMTDDDRVDEVDALLDHVGLRQIAQRRAADLSVGEAQRAAVARALIKSPSLIIADEPSGSLDGAAAKAVGDLLLAPSAGRSVLIATHDQALAARCDRILQLSQGRLS